MIDEKAKSPIILKWMGLKDSVFRRKHIDDAFEKFRVSIGLEVKEEEAVSSYLKISLESDEQPENYIEVTMVGKFETSKGFPFPKDDFFHINAPAIIYPYIRQHIRSLSLDAGIKPIILPLINFEALYEAKKKEQKL
jgi:Preprotein translocase subunit SecB